MLDPQECAIDYARGYSDKSRIYFIEKYLYTFNAMEGKKTPFRLFPRQKVFLQTLATNKNVVSIKPRQCGITTLSSAWATAQCAFAEPDAPETILCIGNKLDLAQQLITKIHDFLLQVPRWYWGEEYYSEDPKSEKNLKSIFVKDSKSELELFNGCRIVARSSSENAARGISAVSILIMDEAAFIENGKAVYATACATMASNPNAKTVIVSTPNGHDELYYNIYRQAMANENNFIAVQFRWYQDPRYNKNLKWFRKNENTGEIAWIEEPTLDKSGTVKYDEEHWEDLIQKGWTPRSPWYEDMCRSFNNDSVKIAQELDVSFAGSSDNVVAPEYIEMHEKLNVREPLEDMKDPVVEETWFWKKPIDGHRYICSCLPTGEQVLTQRGLVNVEDVKANDLLVTKEGEFTKIKHRKYRDVEDEEVVEITLHNSNIPVKFTWNHPIWSSIDNRYKIKGIKKEGKWIKRWSERTYNFKFNNANDIDNKSWVVIPNHYKINSFCEEHLLHIFSEMYPDLSKELCISEDFWWYCGMWLAEGCVREKNSYIQTTHNINETEYIEKIGKVIKENIGKTYSIQKRAKYNSSDVVFYSYEMKKFLLETFGHYAHGKFISDWVKRMPEKYKLKLLQGYFDGDGHYAENGEIRVSTVSKTLSDDVQDVLLSCGIISSIKVRKGKTTIENGKEVTRKDSFIVQIGKIYSDIFKSKIGIATNGYENDKINFYSYFSDDYNFIYIKVKKVNKLKYTGKVYNFETESESHTFCGRRIATHNCDPSRGSSNDYTAIEIIDMDGRDEDGLPIVEQVCEFYGKRLGDDVGELLYNYGTLYNNAYIVIDCTNGLGDVPLFALIRKGYKNIYYDDSELRKYTVQQTNKPFSTNTTDVMPGFHMQGNRYPVLANFANMIRNNEFKVRSARVITELNTWIFKGEAKRMDHQDDAHDDAITCLAMGLFVMMYSYKKLEKAQEKDKAILNAYMTGGSIQTSKRRSLDGQPITPSNGLPFYNEKSLSKYSGVNGSLLWLFSGYY